MLIDNAASFILYSDEYSRTGGCMMKKVIVTLLSVFYSIAAILGVLFPESFGLHDAYAQTVVNVQRKMTIEKNMDLSELEKNPFWTLYGEYRQAMDRVHTRMEGVITDYVAHAQNLTDDKARALIREYISTEKATVQVKEQYIGKFSSVLPPQKVIRFVQIENRLDATMDLEIARRIPLAR